MFIIVKLDICKTKKSASKYEVNQPIKLLKDIQQSMNERVSTSHITTVESCSNRFQGTKKFYLLLVEFYYSQNRKLNNIGQRDQELAFKDRFP